MNAQIRSMTSGSPWKMILAVALPLMLGNVFQQFYTVVDTAVVGQVLGVSALAALGTVDWLNWLFLGTIQGLTQGFSIRIAQDFGAGDRKSMRRSMASAIRLSFFAAVLLMAAAECCIVPAQNWMGAPQEVRGMAGLYLRILFGSLPVIVVYNLSACTLRALGDSRTPLAAMIISSVTNIVLDLAFVAGFGWGVAGAAAATVLAHALAAGICLATLLKVRMLIPERDDWRPDAARDLILLKLGLPVSAQNFIIAAGGIYVQSVVNGFGVVFIAGYTATNKLYGLLEIAAVSYGYAMTTYAGQNLGAGRIARIRTGVRSACVIGIITSLVIAAVMIGFGHPILRLFLNGETGDAEAALQTAYAFLTLMSLWLPVLYILHVVRSALQGLGNTMTPMLSGIVELLARTGAAFILPRFIGGPAVFWCEVLAWLGADLILIPGYFLEMRKVRKNCPEAASE